jgi:Domain of unknown function (DUF305)
MFRRLAVLATACLLPITVAAAQTQSEDPHAHSQDTQAQSGQAQDAQGQGGMPMTGGQSGGQMGMMPMMGMMGSQMQMVPMMPMIMMVPMGSQMSGQMPMTGGQMPMIGGAAQSQAAQGYMAAMQKMSQDMMKMEMKGDPTADFVRMMTPHHQSAIAMAQVLLKEPNADPQIKSMAEKIISDQQKEIDEFNKWLDQHK